VYLIVVGRAHYTFVARVASEEKKIQENGGTVRLCLFL